MIHAIVFDFDGTMLDTETPWYEAYREAFREEGAELPLDVYIRCVGTSLDHFDPLDYLEERLGRPVDRAAVKERTVRYHRVAMERADLRPGVRERLAEARARGFRIGLASSSHKSWVEPFLQKYGLADVFDCLRTADHVRKVKPDPELYVQAVECLGVQPAEAVAVEDSVHGASAALAAGLHCVAVPNPTTAHSDFRACGLKLASLADMTLDEIVRLLVDRSDL